MEIDIIDDLKQPEYTGENRCEPCTILNLAIAVVVGSLVARKTKLGGLLAVGVSIALIYLRGYLVPGTPTLTKRYLPPEVLRWFGKEPEPQLASGFGSVEPRATDADGADTASIAVDDTGATDDEAAGVDASTDAEETTVDDEPSDATATDPEDAPVDLETFFLEHEILEPCAEKDDLCLTDAFEADWLEAAAEVDEAGVDAAAAIDAFDFDADPDEFELESSDDAQLLVGTRGIAGRWPSRAALVADVGASRVLETWTPDWDAHDPETKGQVLNGLRMFLETCPTAGGAISMNEEVVESCCTSHDVIAVTCDETGERLFEQRLDSVDA